MMMMLWKLTIKQSITANNSCHFLRCTMKKKDKKNEITQLHKIFSSFKLQNLVIPEYLCPQNVSKLDIRKNSFP